MKKHLYYYPNHTAFQSSTDQKNIHNVVYCSNEAHLHYDYHDYSKDYFTIESLENNNIIYLKASNSALTKTISVSTDNGSTWTEYTSSTDNSGTTLATLNKGNKLLIRGQNDTYGTSSYYNQFSTTGQFEVKGNIMSLISGDSFVNTNELTVIHTFRQLFLNCTGLTSAENLVLPTTLANSCYDHMFRGCTKLTVAPKLSATILTNYCYNGMFDGCTSLTTAPTLLATTLANSCYQFMFQNCTSLTVAPELPITTLTNGCYSGMFFGCTSLTTAPELPAKTLAQNCYNNMFASCTNLNYIKAMFVTTPGASVTSNWVNGVASTGTFVKSTTALWDVTGISGIPSGWTVQNASN